MRHALAELLRLGSVKGIWQHSAEQEQLKELVRTHENLVADCTRIMNRLRAIYRSRGIQCSGSSLYDPEEREQWLNKLTAEGVKFRAETLFAELETLTRLRHQAHQTMLRQARQHGDFKRLCTIPGLGSISVSRLLA